VRKGSWRPRELSRRDFLKAGGAGLAGAAFLGAAGCTGDEHSGGTTKLYFTTRSALYDDPEIQEKVPVVALAKEALQHTRPRPVSPYYSDMSLEMAEQFNASLKGETTPKDAARTLKRELESIIQQGQES
jgi:ABC-type glycerol-3-phosphate transport system substrate-binding protein